MYKSLNMNLVSIKKHESVLSKNEPISLFSGEVIPITNRISIFGRLDKGIDHADVQTRSEYVHVASGTNG